MKLTSGHFRFGLLLAAALALAGAQAFGQSTITQTNTFSSLPDPADQDLIFNQFDPSLGTLTSVQIDLTNVVVSGTASVTNESGGKSRYTISLAGDYVITDSHGKTVDVTLTTPTQNSGNISSGTTFTTTTETSAPVGVKSVLFSDAPSLAPYIGNGTTGATVVLTSDNSVDVVSGATPNTTSQISTGSGTYELIYTYTPVPEPSKSAIFTIGFAMCLLVGRTFMKRRGLNVP